jgi:hypothetical protein
MTKIKFHIQSKTELVLDEDAKKGDILDLNEEQNIDTSIIDEKISEMVNSEVESKKSEWERNQEKFAKQQLEAELIKKDSETSSQITELKTKLDAVATDSKKEIENQLLKKEAEVKDTLNEKDRLISELNNKLENKNTEKELEVKNTKEKYEIQLSSLTDQLAQAKDFKAKQSTKAIGEDLEIYAKNEFDKIRMMAYPNAYFEKDNEVDARGSKADFIFRDYQDGLEYVSIIFDMKTEMESTTSKHKNSDFFKELDKDRQSKGTEYAVLVSQLEAENDYYNLGIVQVHEYPKMYVVRPQLMLQLIGLITSAAKNSIEYKLQLENIKEQNIDTNNFLDNLNSFKNNFSITSKNFNGNLDSL